MRLVAASIQTQPFKLHEGRRVRTALGVQGMTATEVKGFGQQKRPTEICRGTAHALSFVLKVRIDLVASEQADEVEAAIQDTARTGQAGDGNIFVSPIKRAVRIRTAEADKAAVQTFTDITCDEEGDHGIWDIRAPKTRVSRGCSLGNRDSLSCIR
jgi:nitrogen regulatory protein P-II 2